MGGRFKVGRVETAWRAALKLSTGLLKSAKRTALCLFCLTRLIQSARAYARLQYCLFLVVSRQQMGGSSWVTEVCSEEPQHVVRIA